MRVPFILERRKPWLSEKGARVVKLIKAVRAAGAIVPGNKVSMPEEQPATYIGPVMDGGIQMHAFRLFDGLEVVLEVPLLNRAPGRVALLLAYDAADPANK